MHSSSWPERLLTSPQVSPPVACLGSKDHRLGPWASSQASWWTKAASFLASAESFITSAESLRTSSESFRTLPKLLHSSRCCFWVNSLSSLIRSNAFAFASELPMLNCSSRRRVVVRSAETRLGAACPHPVGGSHGSACLSGPRAVGTACAVRESGWPRPRRGSASRSARPAHLPAPSSSGREVCSSAPTSVPGVSPSLRTLFVGSFLPVLRM